MTQFFHYVHRITDVARAHAFYTAVRGARVAVCDDDQGAAFALLESAR